MLICLSCALTGAIVPLDVLTFPIQHNVVAEFTLWRCPGCSTQGAAS